MKYTLYIILLVILTGGCREPEVQPTGPALLVNPNMESYEEVTKTISAALNGVEVSLSEDVFTTYSIVVIERGMIRGINHPPELGRDLGRPSRFQLILDGTDCVIVDEQSGVHWPLTNVECVKEN